MASKEAPKEGTGFIVSKVVHEFYPVTVDPIGGRGSFGAQVDQFIIEALHDNSRILGFELIIKDADWWKVQEAYRELRK